MTKVIKTESKTSVMSDKDEYFEYASKKWNLNKIKKGSTYSYHCKKANCKNKRHLNKKTDPSYESQIYNDFCTLHIAK